MVTISVSVQVEAGSCDRTRTLNPHLNTTRPLFRQFRQILSTCTPFSVVSLKARSNGASSFEMSLVKVGRGPFPRRADPPVSLPTLGVPS